MIDAVADRPAGNRTNGTADESTAKSVATTAVVADNGACERAEGATGDSTLLGVRPGAGASGKQRRQRE